MTSQAEATRAESLNDKGTEDVLEGTTRRVFRFVFHQHKPVGVHDVQRGLGLSSPSVAQYHITKLLKAGLLKEEQGGYTTEKNIFENMIRVGRTALPLQLTYAMFFLTALLLMVAVMRPSQVSSFDVFAFCVVVVALGITSFEAYKAAKTLL